MPLEPGTTLGPYSVTAKIGEGGMGEVYRARDTKLDRDVALKVLPEAFTQDPDRLARFEREAKVLASLNHPNIAQIHGLEESDGVRALVLELVEGPTLADRIKQGAIPLDEALPIAKQIAEALEAAHEKGIIHRDLKPANIKVRDDGMVKVLDFGLAKAFQPDASDPGLSQSPTISLTAAATQMGMVIGTAAYMAPEQAKGKVVDKRADVWAFGAVLYEMLSGKKPFEGDDVSDTLALVLKFEPDWDALPSDTPARLRQLVQTCLQKNPKQRVHDVADVRLAMEGAFEARDEAPSAAVVPLALHAWQRPIPAAIAALVIAVAGAMAWSLANPAPVPSGTVTRFPFFPPEGDSMDRGDGIALSPDGTTLVYTSLSDGVRRLYVRTRDQMTVRPLPGTERARMPFFSPDGAWVGFFAVGELKKVALVGGPSVTLCEAGPPSGATWGQDDKIVFTSLGALGLMQVSAAGGEPRLLTEAVAGATHAWPAFVPGGKAVLFTIRQEESLGAYEVAVVSLDTGEQQTLLRGTDGAVTASGHLVFARAASLWAVPFDTDRLTVFGEPTPMVEGVQVSAGGWAHYTLADDGTLIYRPAGGGLRRSLAWVDRDGAQEPINVPPRAYTYARLSPDGGLIALDSRDDESDIWIWDVERETLQRLTRDPGMNRGPVWSPDGQQIAFTAVRDGTESIHWQAADGSGAPEPLSTETGFPFGFTPDGRRLLFTPSLVPPGDIGILDVDGSGQATLLLDQSFDETNAQISPDGRWLAYESDESGRVEIYVRPFPDVDSALYPVSTGGGSRPRWSSEGDELFYYVDPGTIMSVPLTSGAELVLGRPEVAVQGAYDSPLNTGTHYDVSPDGRRFLLIVEEEALEGEATPPPIVVVLNWFQELLERVPVP